MYNKISARMISYPFFSKKLFNILKAISIKTIVVFFMIMMNSIKKVMMRLSITILLLGIRLASMKNTNSSLYLHSKIIQTHHHYL